MSFDKNEKNEKKMKNCHCRTCPADKFIGQKNLSFLLSFSVFRTNQEHSYVKSGLYTVRPSLRILVDHSAMVSSQALNGSNVVTENTKPYVRIFYSFSDASKCSP